MGVLGDVAVGKVVFSRRWQYSPLTFCHWWRCQCYEKVYAGGNVMETFAVPTVTLTFD